MLPKYNLKAGYSAEKNLSSFQRARLHEQVVVMAECSDEILGGLDGGPREWCKRFQWVASKLLFLLGFGADWHNPPLGTSLNAQDLVYHSDSQPLTLSCPSAGTARP